MESQSLIESPTTIEKETYHWQNEKGDWNIGRFVLNSAGFEICDRDDRVLMWIWPNGNLLFVDGRYMTTYPASPIPTP